MLCDKCGKNKATTHIEQIINGKKTTYFLCDECAAKEGYGNIQSNSLTDMLASMFGNISPVTKSVNTLRCPICGSSYRDIANSGKVGCAECYHTFYNQLFPYLKRVHGTVDHAGKRPDNTAKEISPVAETTEDLRNQLKELITQEKYEEAAIIRDKIKELEGNLNE